MPTAAATALDSIVGFARTLRAGGSGRVAGPRAGDGAGAGRRWSRLRRVAQPRRLLGRPPHPVRRPRRPRRVRPRVRRLVRRRGPGAAAARCRRSRMPREVALPPPDDAEAAAAERPPTGTATASRAGGPAAPGRGPADRRASGPSCAGCSPCWTARRRCVPRRRMRPHRSGPLRPAAHGPRRCCSAAASRRGSRTATRTVRPRRVVLLLDVSGSMAAVRRHLAALRARLPCARARGDRGLHPRHPADPGHPRAAAAATPTRRWPRCPTSSRTGAAAPGSARTCRQFLDRYGQRGTARGAVVVIVSDGWERGDCAAAGRADGPAAPARPPGGLGQPAPGRDPASSR